jgi:hypothetical protein
LDACWNIAIGCGTEASTANPSGCNCNATTYLGWARVRLQQLAQFITTALLHRWGSSLLFQQYILKSAASARLALSALPMGHNKIKHTCQESWHCRKPENTAITVTLQAVY